MSRSQVDVNGVVSNKKTISSHTLVEKKSVIPATTPAELDQLQLNSKINDDHEQDPNSSNPKKNKKKRWKKHPKKRKIQVPTVNVTDIPKLTDIPFNSTLRPNRQFQLILLISSGEENPSYTLKGTLSVLSSYQNHFSFKCVLFTTSPGLIAYAKELKIETTSEMEVNKFNMPILNSFFAFIKKQQYTYDYIGYMNSDILLHPGIFHLLDSTTFYIQQKHLPPNVELASRVANTISFFGPPRCQNIKLCFKHFEMMKLRMRMRTPTSADVFIFAYSFPLEKIPDLVIGRRYIDPILTTLPFNIDDGVLIDISYANINFHQGFDTYANHMKDTHESENDVYNRRFLVRPVWSCKDSHYKACSDYSIARKC